MNKTSGPIESRLRQGVPLAELTTLGIGGPADLYLSAESEDDVAAAFHFAAGRGLEVFVLGGGSNVIISDSGFRGLVLHIDIHGIEMDYGEAGSPRTRVRAAAGEDWDGFVAYCVREELAGIECLSGIPGSVGGTPVQNVGAYGQEVAESIVSVHCFDRARNRFVKMRNRECGFSYRKSIFNTTMRGRYVVLAVEYELTPGGEPKVVYPELERELAQSGFDMPTLAEVRNAVIAIRKRKSMVIDADDPNTRSAGSFFKNPIIAITEYDTLVKRFGPNVPKFPVDSTRVKIPAAWLMERAGFKKGDRLGNAGVSSRHSLALINLGGATAAEILALRDKIRASVSEMFGIALEQEPEFIG